MRWSSPESRRNALGDTIVPQLPALLQKVQLQRPVPLERSRVASKRTAPQWQPPVKVRGVGVDSLMVCSVGKGGRRARRVDEQQGRSPCGQIRSAIRGPVLQTSARLLKLLSLLQARRFWSGEELAEALGVTERSVR